jgi:tetratricopeptide (TPR) repeat protein
MVEPAPTAQARELATAQPPASDPATPIDAPSPAAQAPAPKTEPTQAAGASAAPQSAASDAERQLRELAKSYIDAGEIAKARATLDDLMTGPLVSEARSLLEQRKPEEALAVADQAVAAAPGEPRALLVHGEASLQVGLRRNDAALLEGALVSFQRSGPTAAALFGASRSARALGRNEEALRYAHDGWRALETAGADELRSVSSFEAPERTLAEAAWSGWVETRALADERTKAAFGEADDALARLVERVPLEAWGWLRSAELYRDVGRRADEQRVLERGIAARPNDGALFEGLAASLAAGGDAAAALACFERLEKSQPQSPLPWWFAGSQRFELALANPASESIDQLRTAEHEFATCRARGGTALGQPLQREALCRTAVGWCLLHDDNLEGALSAFRSADQLMIGARRLDAAPRLSSGIDGIAAVADAYVRREDRSAAAKVYLELHHYEPNELLWARRAGELHLSSGERMQQIGEDCKRASKGKIQDERRLRELRQRIDMDANITSEEKVRSEFKRKGERWIDHAQDQFATSYACFRDAVAIAPDDVRTLTDCAKVAVTHLDNEFERAEGFLRRAVQLGETHVDDPALSPEQRQALRAAWGDAHQYLGKLYLEHRHDPRAARAWFQKSVEIDPPRPEVTDNYLPACEKALQQAK